MRYNFHCKADKNNKSLNQGANFKQNFIMVHIFEQDLRYHYIGRFNFLHTAIRLLKNYYLLKERDSISNYHAGQKRTKDH